MRCLRHLLLCVLCGLLPLLTFAGCGGQAIAEAPTIALMPLDSRPCNTQYPELLAEVSTAELLLPPEDAMDHFLEPADRDALWQWLESAAEDADALIIFTNSLFCGSLIASRSSGAYDNIDDDLARLKTLCANTDAPITVVQVLPRLTPNQFDSVLYPYVDALTPYGRAWDEADAAGETPPDSVDGVPEEALLSYRALHEKSAALAEALNTMAADGLIDRLLIAQDDGDAYCPANITFRTLEAKRADNTELLHGADELGMLLVSACAADGLAATPVRLVYSTESSKDRCYPYESVTLAEMTAQKLALSGLETNEDADTILWLHTDTADAAETTAAASDHDGRFALADVALTNEADPALADTLLSSQGVVDIDAYAGWNTAGNSIGTVCAMLRAMDALDARWDNLSSDAQEHAVSALYRFRAIRLAEDVCYMAELRSDLQTAFSDEGLSDYTTAFTDDAAWQTANTRLAEAFAPYSDTLASLFDGPHTLSLAHHDIPIIISDFSASASYPWSRSFEVKVTPELTVTLEE